MSAGKKTLIAVGSILATLILAYYVLFLYTPVVDTSDYSIPIDEMRSLSIPEGESNQALPVSLNSMIIAEGQFPSAAVMAGDSLFENTNLVFVSFQLIYSDGHHIILDTAQDSSLHNEFYEGQPFYDDRFDAMQEAMKEASLIVATHEHVDHVGGIAQSPYLTSIKDRVRLTSEQINGPTIEAARFPEGVLEELNPLEYDGLHLLAPGVVLKKAPGHSEGSQLIFVKLQSGVEYLFVGDIAWKMRNIDEQRGRPAVVSWIFLQEDREQVAQQLLALKNLKSSHPELRLVVAHDGEDLERLRNGGMGQGFQ